MIQSPGRRLLLLDPPRTIPSWAPASFPRMIQCSGWCLLLLVQPRMIQSGSRRLLLLDQPRMIKSRASVHTFRDEAVVRFNAAPLCFVPVIQSTALHGLVLMAASLHPDCLLLLIASLPPHSLVLIIASLYHLGRALITAMLHLHGFLNRSASLYRWGLIPMSASLHQRGLLHITASLPHHGLVHITAWLLQLRLCLMSPSLLAAISSRIFQSGGRGLFLLDPPRTIRPRALSLLFADASILGVVAARFASAPDDPVLGVWPHFPR